MIINKTASNKNFSRNSVFITVLNFTTPRKLKILICNFFYLKMNHFRVT